MANCIWSFDKVIDLSQSLQKELTLKRLELCVGFSVYLEFFGPPLQCEHPVVTCTGKERETNFRYCTRCQSASIPAARKKKNQLSHLLFTTISSLFLQISMLFFSPFLSSSLFILIFLTPPKISFKTFLNPALSSFSNASFLPSARSLLMSQGPWAPQLCFTAEPHINCQKE